jgi:Transcriptional regulator, AbiEi antitoxin
VADTVRSRIIALVTEHDVLRMSQIMSMLGLSRGSAGGHLTWLVRHGKLDRPWRGVYTRPGYQAASMPPWPSHNTVRRNRTVRENMTREAQQAQAGALAASRAAVTRYQPGRRAFGPERILSAGQVGKALGLTPKAIQHHAARGRMPFDVTPGGHRRYNLAETRTALKPYRRASRPQGGGS